MYNNEEPENMNISISNGIRKPVMGTSSSKLENFKNSLAQINSSFTGKDAENLANKLVRLEERDRGQALNDISTLSYDSKMVLTEKLMSGIKGCDKPEDALNLLLPHLELCSKTEHVMPNGGKVIQTPLSSLLMNLKYASNLSGETKSSMVHAMIDQVSQSDESLSSFIDTNKQTGLIKDIIKSPCFSAVFDRLNELGLT